jgi:L-alanine-DL-glutamate epimerase-like enolase superfamily enzyme
MKDDLLTEPLEIADGVMAVRTEPGLGIAIDSKKLEYYRKDQ